MHGAVPQSSAAPRGIVRGTVKDSNAAVAWHTFIQIYKIPDDKALLHGNSEPVTDRPLIAVEADQRSQFSVDLPAGTYRICAGGEGYTTVCRTVRAEAGQEVMQDFSLNFDPVFEQSHAPADSEVMDQRLRKLAGSNATDCGHVKVNESPNGATACALEAFKHKTPFYVRYDLAGIDSFPADGLASDSAGNIYGVIFDTMGWSSDHLAPAATMPDGSHTIVLPCPKPVRLKTHKTGTVTCFSKRKPFLLSDQR